MFGRPLSTLLGSPKDIEVIYKEFKRLCFLKRKEAFHKLNKKNTMLNTRQSYSLASWCGSKRLLIKEVEV